MALNRIIFVFCFFCFFQAVPLVGQPVFFDVQQASKIYKNESFIILNRNDSYTIKLIGDSLHIVRKRKEQYLYLKNMAAFDTERSLQSSSFVELTDYSANTFIPNGSKFKKIPVNKVAINNSAQGNVFFDDEKEYIFTFPGLQNGAIIELESTHDIHEAHFIPSMFFQSVVPIYRLHYRIECDKSIHLNFTNFNVHSLPIDFTTTETNKKKIYTWTGSQLQAVKEEPNQPSLRYFIGHTIPVIDSYIKNNGDTIAFLSSTKDLYTWYYSFIESINAEKVSENLKQLSDSITTGQTTEYDKAKAIFYWVQANIKYIAFEDGMGGLIPRNADDVYHKRFGDCKDKTSLMQTLMTNQNIKAYFCWIGSDDIPYSYNEVHSPVVDNHMILAAEIDSNFHFLDGTGTFQNFEIPTSFIQGKEALIAISKDSFLIKKVPIVPAQSNNITNVVNIAIDSSLTIHGNGKISLSGYSKQYLQKALLGENVLDQKSIIDNYIEIGNNKCILETYSLPQIDNYDTTTYFPYSFSIENYIVTYNDEIFINLNLYQDWTRFHLQPNRQTPLSFKYASSFDYTFSLEIPEGYKVNFIPENTEFSKDQLQYSIQYSISDTTIIYTHRIGVNARLITPDMFSSWADFITNLKSDYRQTVSLVPVK